MAESNFSLQMFRWVNNIIQFVGLTQKLVKTGIYDIENKMLAYKQKRLDIQKVFLCPKLFKRLKADAKAVSEIEELSASLSSFGSDDELSRMSMTECDFELSQKGFAEGTEETKE